MGIRPRFGRRNTIREMEGCGYETSRWGKSLHANVCIAGVFVLVLIKYFNHSFGLFACVVK